MTFENVKNWFELLSYIATIIGIPIAIIVYVKGKRDSKKFKENQVGFPTGD